MFTRWLLTVLPADMRAGWRLVSANLPLWIGLATLAALSAPVAAAFQADATSLGLRFVGLAAILVGLAKDIAGVSLFDDAFHRRDTDWSRAASLVLRRAVPFVLCVTLTVGGSLIAAELVMSAVAVTLENTPLSEPMVPVFGILIYVTLLARFAFVPFLVVIRTFDTLPSWLREKPSDMTSHHANNSAAQAANYQVPLLARLPASLAKLIWPFVASTKLTDGMRWRLAPYLGLVYLMRFAGRDLPDGTQVLFAAATFIVGLTAQAVLFSYYCLRLKE